VLARGTIGWDLRILLTVHQFLPEQFAGTETLTYWTARELRALGHEVRVLTARLSESSTAAEACLDTYEYEGLRVYRFYCAGVPTVGQRNLVEAEYNNHLAARTLQEVLAEYRPDVVHFFHLARLSASLVEICRRSRLPTVLTATDFWFLCPTTQLRLPDNSPCRGPDRSGVNCLRHFLYWTGRSRLASMLTALPDAMVATVISACRSKALGKIGLAAGVQALADRPRYLRARLNEVDRVLVPTRLMERLLTSYGLERSKAVYCPFGIEVREPSHRRDLPLRRPEEPLRVGFIGTLVEHKGVHILIAAVRQIAGQPIALQIYGRPEDFPDYAAQLRAQAAGDERIGFLGTFSIERIGEVFAGIDVLVVPSLWYENTPLVVYSAQAFGCPVVASDFEGLSEVVVHGENGLLFAAGDVNALARSLERLIREPDLLARLSRSARPPKPIARYAAECVAVYDEVIASGRRSSAGDSLTTGNPSPRQ